MDFLVSLGISVGVLAGLWCQFSGDAKLITWIAVASWACFYAIGGKKEGVFKTVPSNLSGVIWGIIIVYGLNHFGFHYALGVYIALGVFFMCVQAKWSVLSFIPGSFIGIACYFGSGNDWKGTMLALVIGACLGYISEIGAVYISKIGKKTEATAAGK